MGEESRNPHAQAAVDLLRLGAEGLWPGITRDQFDSAAASVLRGLGLQPTFHEVNMGIYQALVAKLGEPRKGVTTPRDVAP